MKNYKVTLIFEQDIRAASKDEAQEMASFQFHTGNYSDRSLEYVVEEYVREYDND
jgi:hypothetical protein